jgi:hypothetical protein
VQDEAPAADQEPAEQEAHVEGVEEYDPAEQAEQPVFAAPVEMVPPEQDRHVDCMLSA